MVGPYLYDLRFSGPAYLSTWPIGLGRYAFQNLACMGLSKGHQDEPEKWPIGGAFGRNEPSKTLKLLECTPNALTLKLSPRLPNPREPRGAKRQEVLCDNAPNTHRNSAGQAPFRCNEEVLGYDRWRSRRTPFMALPSLSAVRGGRFFTTSGGPWRRATETSKRLVAGFQRLWAAVLVSSISLNATNSSP